MCVEPSKILPFHALDVSNKHYILVFWGQFAGINICDFWIAYSSNSAAKNTIYCKIFVIAYAIESLHGENVQNLSFDVTLMPDHLLVCRQLEIFSSFPKTNNGVYRCRSVQLFFDMYCICRETYFLDDIKSDNLWKTVAWAFNLKFSGMRSTTCSENILFVENRLCESRSS